MLAKHKIGLDLQCGVQGRGIVFGLQRRIIEAESQQASGPRASRSTSNISGGAAPRETTPVATMAA